MEHRHTAGLDLEMPHAHAPDEYAQARVDDVLGLEGVERATWWRNAKRDRRDLPRVLPNRLPPAVPATIAVLWGGLANGPRATGADVVAGAGVAETTARSIRETLNRVTESTILDQYS